MAREDYGEIVLMGDGVTEGVVLYTGLGERKVIPKDLRDDLVRLVMDGSFGRHLAKLEERAESEELGY